MEVDRFATVAARRLASELDIVADDRRTRRVGFWAYEKLQEGEREGGVEPAATPIWRRGAGEVEEEEEEEGVNADRPGHPPTPE